MRWILTLLAFISLNLWAREPRPFDVLKYTFNLSVNDTNNQIEGRTQIDLQITAAEVPQIILDLVSPKGKTGMTVAAVTSADQKLAFTHKADHLIITLPQPAQAGQNLSLTVAYRGVPEDGLIISKNKHGERTFFGDNWPQRARHWLAVVDHPSDKAQCEFVITAPSHYQVIANGTLREETDLGDGRRLTRYTTDAPLATKVMTVGIARFAVSHLADFEPFPLQTWVFPQDRKAGFHDFARAAPILEFFIEKIGPYPYQKLANVQSKTRFGGLENASAIFYNQDTLNGERDNERLIAHEIAHQWFGDAVTETDWPHFWLSEGFATYFAALYLEHRHGIDRLNQQMAKHRDRIFEHYHKNPGETVIPARVDDPMNLLNAYCYDKGAWVLHMLRGIMGDEAYWQAIREFYSTHRNGNAQTADFVDIAEDHAKKRLSWFFSQWLQRPGHPNYQGTWFNDEEAGAVEVRIHQENVASHLFIMPVELQIETLDGQVRTEIMWLDQAENTFLYPVDTPATNVTLDPRQIVLKTAEFTQGRSE
jgi:aminopeptidase N